MFWFLLSCFSVVVCDMNASVPQGLPSPYNELSEILPFNGHGWYENGQWLSKLIRKNNVKTVIEVGSWLGSSTRHIASMLPENGMVYAIDTWEGSVEHALNNNFSGMLPTLYQQFLSNVVHAKLVHKIIPIKKHSLDAAKILFAGQVKADLIYIDAAHDTESVYRDLVAYFPFVANNKGILCGDDWLWDSVRSAVDIFAHHYNLAVYSIDNFWFIAEEGHCKVSFALNCSEDVWQFPK